MTKSVIRNNVWAFVLLACIVALIWSIGYQTPRTNFEFFIGQYLLLFGVFYGFWRNKMQWKFQHFLLVAIGLRFILFWASPELSNDFFRFIWDGELLTRGINPFAHTPQDLISHNGFMDERYMRVLYHGMGELSQSHYTCYPVVNQLLFVPAALTDDIGVNIKILKSIIILADIGAIFIARKIALHLNVAIHNIWLYFLNPFIILEFSGNLHFEGVMIFFLLGAIYFVMKAKWINGGILFGIAVQVKLIPLMLIPFVYKKLKILNSIGFTALVGVVVLAVGGLMLNTTFFGNMMESVNEYFVRFQFNSSIYNVLINYVYAPTDWDRFEVAGKLLSYISTAGILTLALLKAYRNDLDIIKGMLFAFMIYYAFATTVHPWYISLVLVLSVFTKYRFGVVWSLVIMFSYYAYSNEQFEQNPILLVAEYVLVYGVMIYEIIRYWQKDTVGLQLKSFFSR